MSRNPKPALCGIQPYKDGSSKGVWNGGINKNMAASVKALVQQCRYLNR
jgi:hypothetical protein